MNKKLFAIISIVLFSVSAFATKSEKELDKLFIGMPLERVKVVLGEPTYSKFEKDTKIRMLLYNLYRQEGGFVEYHIYLKNDSLTKVIRYDTKSKESSPILGLPNNVNRDDDYTIEGKCLVVSKIFENIELSNEQIADAVAVAISRACNGSQGEIKLKEANRVLYHGIIDKVITFDWRWGSINVFYTIDVAIKQGRARVKIIGEEIDWHQDHERATYYFSETIPIGKNSMKDVSLDAADDMVRNTVGYFKQYISVIGEEITKMVDDEW